MKKIYKLLCSSVVFLLSFVFLLNFASADVASTVTNIVSGVENGLKPVFQAALGSANSGSELTIQILAFLLVAFIIYGILAEIRIFGDKNWINAIVGIIVSIIGIRFLPSGILESLAIPSSALVATIVLVIPIVIAFLLMNKIDNVIARKAIWITYAVIVGVLWAYNVGNPNLGGFEWIYIFVIAACALFFWFDGTLRRWITKAQSVNALEQATADKVSRIIGELESREREKPRGLSGGALSAYDRKTAELRKELKDLQNTL